jgi:hypothetical protein
MGDLITWRGWWTWRFISVPWAGVRLIQGVHGPNYRTDTLHARAVLHEPR